MPNPICIRVTENYYMQKIIAIIVCWAWFLQASAQPNIVFAEYFVDNDPGFGNATSISIVPSPNISDNLFNVSIGSLLSGLHTLFIRSKDANGKWSVTNPKIFYKTSASGISSNITRAEYFFDTDPGFGNATNIPVTAGTDVPNINLSASIGGLTAGVHYLSLRSKNANGIWSVTNNMPFYKPGPVIGNIVNAEYFFDTDPGFGNATNISITPGTNLQNTLLNLSTASLIPGLHFLSDG